MENIYITSSFAPWSILLYALLVAGGGVMGYLKVHSKMSLISGLVSGGLLIVAFAVSLSNLASGLMASCGIAIALTVVFALRFQKTQKFMPAGLLAGVSAIAAVLYFLAWRAG
jgi:uncharacterized membrane protein (UPF0136 family)